MTLNAIIDRALGRQNPGCSGEINKLSPEIRGKNLTTTKDYKYVWWGDAKESKITISGVTQVKYQGYWVPGYARFIYDVNGHISAMNDPSYNNANASVYTARSVWYTTDAQGRILMRIQIGDGKPNLDGTIADQTTSSDKMLIHKFFYLNGRGVGDVGTDGMRRMSYAEALAITHREK